jgi:hypothetical protein
MRVTDYRTEPDVSKDTQYVKDSAQGWWHLWRDAFQAALKQRIKDGVDPSRIAAQAADVADEALIQMMQAFERIVPPHLR